MPDRRLPLRPDLDQLKHQAKDLLRAIRAGDAAAIADPDAPAAVDADGIGGHTALFGAVVSYPNFWMNYAGGWAHTRKPVQSDFADLLLDRGANPNARASFREPIADEGRTYREHRRVTPLGWGEAFGNRMVVSEPAMRAIAARGGEK